MHINFRQVGCCGQRFHSEALIQCSRDDGLVNTLLLVITWSLVNTLSLVNALSLVNTLSVLR